MPQLDLSTYISQAFWLLVSFCSLWALLSWFVTPKIANVIEQRKRKIDDYIQKAEKLNTKAKDSLNKYNASLAEAKQKADRELERGHQEIKSRLRQTEAEMTAELNRKIADSELLIAKEKRETLQQIESIAQDLAYEILHKLGFAKISRQDVAAAAREDK